MNDRIVNMLISFILLLLLCLCLAVAYRNGICHATDAKVSKEFWYDVGCTNTVPGKQRILIFNPVLPTRKSQLTYHNVFYNGGFGGTEVAFMEVGKYLCEKGHTVTVVGVSDKTYFDTSSGIDFVSMNDFDLELVNTYNWYCPLFHVREEYHQNIMAHIRDKAKTKVMLWFHCFIDDDVILEYQANGFDVYGVGVSEWVKQHYEHLFDDKHLWVVPNGVSPYFYESRSIDNKTRGSWCFHATFFRGGEAAIRVFDKVSQVVPDAARELHIMSYYTPDANKTVPDFVIEHGSLPKTEVADILERSEYFIYPLVTPERGMHHDTYACVIMEALSLGVIVVTWNVACFPSLYSDYIVAVEPPNGYPKSDRFFDNGGEWFASQEAIDMLAQAIIDLEAAPEKKDWLRQRGAQWARQHTWEQSGESMVHGMQQAIIC